MELFEELADNADDYKKFYEQFSKNMKVSIWQLLLDKSTNSAHCGVIWLLTLLYLIANWLVL